MPAPKVLRLWNLLTADICAEGAAGVKQTPLGQMDGAWNIALQQHALPLGGGVRNRDGGKQCFRIRVPRIAIQLRFGRNFRDTAKIHHGDAVRDHFHNAQVV